MRLRAWHLYLAGIALGAPAPADEKAGPANAPKPATPPSISLKRTEPLSLAAIEHVGPYWTVGQVYSTVRRQMDDKNIRGPLVVRYLRKPRSAPAATLRSYVGCSAPPGSALTPPFQRLVIAPEWVVSTTVYDIATDFARDYPPLHAWIQNHGYQPAGPVTELHRTNGAVPQIEIQMAVSLSEAAAREIERLQGLAPQTGPDPASLPADLPTVEAAVEPLLPIEELLASCQFDRIARQLIRDDPPIPTHHRLWFGQIVFRVSAAAKGIEFQHPGGGSRLSALANAILARYRAREIASLSDSLAQPVATVDVHSDPTATRKREITRGIDNLLANIAHRAVDPDGACASIARSLQAVQDLMYPPPAEPSRRRGN